MKKSEFKALIKEELMSLQELDLKAAVPQDTSYVEFAKAVAKVLDDYGSHNIIPFMKELDAELKKLGLKEGKEEESGPMTPEEEEMIDNYEEREANKYALDKEEPLEEAMLSPEEQVNYLATELKDVWDRGTRNQPVNFEELAKTLVSRWFSEEPMEEGTVTFNIDEVFAEYSDLVKKYKAEGMNKYEAIGQAVADLAAEYNTSHSNIHGVISDYFNDMYMRDGDETIAEADRIVEAWTSRK